MAVIPVVFSTSCVCLACLAHAVCMEQAILMQGNAFDAVQPPEIPKRRGECGPTKKQRWHFACLQQIPIQASISFIFRFSAEKSQQHQHIDNFRFCLVVISKFLAPTGLGSMLPFCLDTFLSANLQPRGVCRREPKSLRPGHDSPSRSGEAAA